MLRLVGRLVRLLLLGFFLGMVASAAAALAAKRRLVSVGGPDDDSVELVAIFRSLDFRSVARSFRGGSLLSWFAGSQLDLRRATLAPAGGDLEVKTIFAGTNVVVPEGWQVNIEGPAIFGANSPPARREAAADAPELRVHALTLFGGMSVSAKAWDLAASEKTVVIGPASPETAGAVAAGVMTAGEGAAGGGPPGGEEATGGAETAPATADPAPTRARRARRRRQATAAGDAPAPDTAAPEGTPPADAG